MTSEWIIYFPTLAAPAVTGDTPCEVCPGDGTWVSTTLDALRHTLPAEPVPDCLVVIDGTCVSSSCLAVPRKQHKYLARILPYLCEENLCSDIEATHLATGAIRGERVQVAAIDRRQLDTLAQQLQEQGVQYRLLTSDSEVLRAMVAADENLLWLDSENCYLVLDQQAIKLEAELLDYALEQLRNSTLRKLNVFTAGQSNPAELNLALEEFSAEGFEVKVNEIPGIPSSPVRQAPQLDSWHAIKDRALNLLQGEYRAKTETASSGIWKPLAIAAAVLVSVHLTYQLASGWYFHSQAESLREDTHALYRSYFPNDRRIVNIRTQTRNHLSGSGQSAGGFLPLLSQFSVRWPRQEKDLNIRSLRYSQQRGEMLLDLQSGSIEQLDALQVALGSGAELLSANENGDGVRGRIRLRVGSL